MGCIHYVALLSVVALLVSCARHNSPRPDSLHPEGLTLERRAQSLEQSLNAEKPKYSKEELRKQWEADFAEIDRLGLANRAKQDFVSRLPDATVTKWSIGFFMDTNTVWCDTRYTLPGNEEILQKEFGYTRRIGTALGTNWNLIWEAETK